MQAMQSNLSASYKDRGASVLVSKVKELEIKQVVEDSSGNAGCAISAYCAKAVLKAAQKIFYAIHSWNHFFFQRTKTCK